MYYSPATPTRPMPTSSPVRRKLRTPTTTLNVLTERRRRQIVPLSFSIRPKSQPQQRKAAVLAPKQVDANRPAYPASWPVGPEPVKDSGPMLISLRDAKLRKEIVYCTLQF
ncbi:hypothetical protein BD413DRAFT_494707 [Trametes elegans]|nr:hypothetical protein BD413DRAFT_494707 [Trametes elegans]